MKTALIALTALPAVAFAQTQEDFTSDVEVSPCSFGGSYDTDGSPCGFAWASTEAAISVDQEQSALEFCGSPVGAKPEDIRWRPNPKRSGHVSEIVSGKNGLMFDITVPMFVFKPDCAGLAEQLPSTSTD